MTATVALTVPRAGRLLVTGDINLMAYNTNTVRSDLMLYHNGSRVYRRVIDTVAFDVVPVSAVLDVGAGEQSVELHIDKGSSNGFLDAMDRGLSLVYLG